MACAGATCFSNLIHLPPIENSKAANPVMLAPGETQLKQLASMLYREHVCVEIGNPLLALLRVANVSGGGPKPKLAPHDDALREMSSCRYRCRLWRSSH